MISELTVYVEELVWDRQFGCCLDLEERRDKVIWILEQEFPEESIDDRLAAMLHVLPACMEVMDHIELVDGEFPW